MVFTLSYKDRDGDDVSISTSRELMDAIALCTDLDSLKLVSDQGFGSGLEPPMRFLANDDTSAKLNELMRPSLEDPVFYNNILCDANDRAVLKHLVDDFKDHITPAYLPRFSWSSDCLRLDWEYSINGRNIKSRYCAIGGIYLDLSEFSSSGGVKLLFPRGTYESIRPVYKGGSALSDCTQTIIARVSSTSSPSFVTLRGSGNSSNPRVGIREDIPLKEILESKKHRYHKIHKIVGLFVIGPPHYASYIQLMGALALSSGDNKPSSLFGSMGIF